MNIGLFIIGVIVGELVGLSTAAFLVANKKQDDESEEFYSEKCINKR